MDGRHLHSTVTVMEGAPLLLSLKSAVIYLAGTPTNLGPVSITKWVTSRGVCFLGQFCAKVTTISAFKNTKSVPVKRRGRYQMNFARES